ncbi:hypothetical protein M758_UG117700 [Ceratodon purpureus]|nr:hypothetical protein M758_UG117700 [Ceratodon purpureus]
MEHGNAIFDEVRVQARDRKLEIREEALTDRQRKSRRTCPCNICLGLNHSKRLRGTLWFHLRKYGRHPFHRGSTKVIYVLPPLHFALLFELGLYLQFQGLPVC